MVAKHAALLSGAKCSLCLTQMVQGLFEAVATDLVHYSPILTQSLSLIRKHL